MKSPAPRSPLPLASAAIVLAMLIVGACAADDSDLKQRCISARASLADARVELLGPPPTEALAKDFEKHRKNYEEGLGDTFLDTCVERGDAFADCILDADSPNAKLDCIRSKQ